MKKIYHTALQNLPANSANVIFWCVVTYICLYKLWLSAVIPFTVPMVYPIDGTWFTLKAKSISADEWMGLTYDQYTLIKGPIYSLFLAIMSQLGISAKLAIDVLYLGASLVFLKALLTTLTNKVAIIAGFTLVLYNPATFSEFWTQPIRINLYASLVLVYLSCLIIVLTHCYQAKAKLPTTWLLLCGISLALAWNTRGESIWMLSGLFPLLLLSLWRIYKQRNRSLPLLSLTIILCIPIITWQILASINDKKYGFHGVSEFKGTQFFRAVNAVYSLNTDDDEKSYIYISKTSIDKLKTISDSTRRLVKGMLKEDGIRLRRWNMAKGDLASWGIRSGMVKAGYHQNIKDTELAYQQIADDIEQFCRNTPNGCRTSYIPGLLIKPQAVKKVGTIALNGFKKFIDFDYFPPALDPQQLKRGDRKFQYLTNRFHKIHSGYNNEYEQLSAINQNEQKRKRTIAKLYKRYQSDYKYLFIIACLVAIITVFSNKQWQPRAIGLMFLGMLISSFSIFVLISSFAVPHFSRVLISSSIPLLCFSAYFLGLGVQNISSLLIFPFKIPLTKSMVKT